MAQDRKPRLMTIDEVAKYLRIHKSTIYRLAKDRRIPASKVGNKWRFRKDVIDRWLSRRENSSSR
ncbi:MAG: helix-turn-helix domain-containing protein [Dehalococcoidia bacterium]|nr:helix-turn-helix domain-containing protein [Dehalococcoidia bacterium]